MTHERFCISKNALARALSDLIAPSLHQRQEKIIVEF